MPQGPANQTIAEPVDKIPKHYEKLAHKNVTINHDRQGREDIYMSNSTDTQQSNMQEHIINKIPVNGKQEENQKHIPIHPHRDKPVKTLILKHIMKDIKKPDILIYSQNFTCCTTSQLAIDQLEHYLSERTTVTR